MNNTYYEQIYDRHIAPLYGIPRRNDEDNILINKNSIPHKYSIIEERVDMTDIECYSIDPPGCEDADDAFSVYEQNEKLYLAIHIADPTEYINLNSDLWKSIEQKIVTRYPSNRKPYHMIPNEIMEISSLMENKYGNIKKAITIITEIDKENYYPIGNVKLLYTQIKVKKENALEYSKARNRIDEIFDLKYGIKISEALIKKRGDKTKGIVLNDVTTSLISYENNIPTLKIVCQPEKKMKQMIAEFAIFANSFVGNYLKIHFNDTGIFRTCNASELLNSENINNMNGDELLQEIISNGIKADYLSKVESHDLVGSEEYTHFTSPIRRVSDCICHYLLKYVFIKQRNKSLVDLNKPFTLEELKSISTKCDFTSKNIKKIQYKDTKFRLIQVMDNMLLNKDKLKLTYYITSYTNGFLNLIVNKIDYYNTYLSYTLRVRNYVYSHKPKDKYEVEITKVNCPKKYDEGSIPELDAKFVK